MLCEEGVMRASLNMRPFFFYGRSWDQQSLRIHRPSPSLQRILALSADDGVPSLVIRDRVEGPASHEWENLLREADWALLFQIPMGIGAISVAGQSTVLGVIQPYLEPDQVTVNIALYWQEGICDTK